MVGDLYLLVYGHVKVNELLEYALFHSEAFRMFPRCFELQYHVTVEVLEYSLV